MDPLSQVLTLLRPQTFTWKAARAHGDWAVRFPASPGGVAFALITEGRCRLEMGGVDFASPQPPSPPGVTGERGGQTPLRLDLAPGDFVLLAAPPPWTLAHGAPTHTLDFQRPPGAEDRLDAVIGAAGAGPAARLIGGHIGFAAADAQLLAHLAPPVIHIPADAPGAERLRGVLALIDAESAADRPGRGLVLDRLLEVMLAEALRCRAGPGAPLSAPEAPGLLAGLADPGLAAALAALHGDIRRPWTVAALAAVAGASRSAFTERFTRRLGLAPARYRLHWRMALAKTALRQPGARVEAVAFAVGYGSASAFSTAFAREVGCAPGRWADSIQGGPPTGVHAT